MFWCFLMSKCHKATVLEYLRGSLHCNALYSRTKSPPIPDTRRHTCRRWAGRGEAMIRDVEVTELPGLHVYIHTELELELGGARAKDPTTEVNVHRSFAQI